MPKVFKESLKQFLSLHKPIIIQANLLLSSTNIIQPFGILPLQTPHSHYFSFLSFFPLLFFLLFAKQKELSLSHWPTSKIQVPSSSKVHTEANGCANPPVTQNTIRLSVQGAGNAGKDRKVARTMEGREKEERDRIRVTQRTARGSRLNQRGTPLLRNSRPAFCNPLSVPGDAPGSRAFRRIMQRDRVKTVRFQSALTVGQDVSESLNNFAFSLSFISIRYCSILIYNNSNKSSVYVNLKNIVKANPFAACEAKIK